MNIDFKSRFRNNFFAQSANKLFLIIQNIALVPLFIKEWGIEYYGDWIVISSIPFLLSAIDLGIGSSCANYFSINWIKEKKGCAASFLKTSIISIIGLSIIATVAILILSITGILDVLIKTESFSKDEKTLLIILFALSIFCTFLSQTFAGCFRVAKKFHLYIHFQNVQILAYIIITTLLLTHGYEALHVALALLFSQTTRLFLSISGIKYYNIKQHLKDSSFAKEKLSQIISKGIKLTIEPLAQSSYLQGSIIILNNLGTSESVVLWSTIRTISRTCTQFSRAISLSSEPEIQMEFFSNQTKNASILLKKTLRLGLTGYTIAAVALTTFGNELYAIWVRNELIIPNSCLTLIIISLLPNTIWIVSSVVQRALNKPEKLAVANIAAALTALILTYFLTPRFGLLGVVVSALLYDIIMILLIYPESKSLIENGAEKCK